MFWNTVLMKLMNHFLWNLWKMFTGLGMDFGSIYIRILIQDFFAFFNRTKPHYQYVCMQLFITRRRHLHSVLLVEICSLRALSSSNAHIGYMRIFFYLLIGLTATMISINSTKLQSQCIFVRWLSRNVVVFGFQMK